MKSENRVIARSHDFESIKSSVLDFHLNTIEMLVNVKSSAKTIDEYVQSIMERRGLTKQQIDLFFL